MVRYLALLAVVGSFFCVDLAEARGRRGCASCGVCVAGGCPGGVCAVPVAPAKGAATSAPPAPIAESAPAVQPAAAATVTPTRYYAATRRGLFGRR